MPVLVVPTAGVCEFMYHRLRTTPRGLRQLTPIYLVFWLMTGMASSPYVTSYSLSLPLSLVTVSPDILIALDVSVRALEHYAPPQALIIDFRCRSLAFTDIWQLPAG